MRPVMNECATRTHVASTVVANKTKQTLLMFCASPQTAARESCCERCWAKPRALAAARCRRLCAVVGAVDGARAANLFGEVEDDSFGRRRDAALAFDETKFDDSHKHSAIYYHY